MKKKIYVGLKLDCTSRREVFKTSEAPTEQSHGHLYACTIGPFQTMRGAKFMAEYGQGNPHVYTVYDAERIARKLAAKK